MSLEGLDVSHWQTSTPSLSGLSFLIARASVGNVTDDRYAMHIGNARKAGLITGAYHFAYHGGIEGQAATFLAAITAVGNVDLCFIDVEGATAPSQAETRTFIDLVHQAGRKCGLYHSASGFFDAGQDYDWVAKWSPTAPANWTFWQYQGSPLDKDRFNGTLGQLAALAGLPPAPDTSTSEELVRLASQIYRTAIVPLAGKPVLDGPGGALIYTTKTGDKFGEVGDTGSYHVMRMPGDIAGYIAHGNIAPTVALPVPTGDTTHTVKLTVDGVEKASVVV